MPYKGGVQLLPETQRRPTLSSYTSGNSYFYAGVTIGIAVIVVGAIFGGYKANLKDRIDALDGQLQASEDGRNKDHERALLDIAKQSRVMRTLLESKIYWSQALGYMERMMQSGVQLQSLDADVTKGTIGFRATAPTYAAVAKQLAAFVAGTGVEDISVNTIETNPQGAIDFSGELKIDAKTLLNKPTTK